MEAAFTTNKRADKGRLLGGITYLIHEDEPRDKYEDYLAAKVKPDILGRNPFNLFDDIDRNDKSYLRAVKIFIKMRMRS